MRSKTLYFNKTLFLKDLSRFWPLWGGASFIGALFPLAMLSKLLRYGGYAGGSAGAPLEMTKLYYDVLQAAVPAVCLLYGLLCAMAVWNYLYNARSAGLMHTLPIRREGLFVTSFLAGAAMLLIPFAVTGTLCVLTSAAFGLFEPVGLLVTILGVLGESFFYFSSATLAAFITGNAFAMPALYLLLHFLEAILDLLLSNFARGFIFGFSTDYTGFLEFLSPTVYLYRNVSMDAEYREIVNSVGEFVRFELVSVRIENLWIIAVYALAGVALLAFAFALYRRRQSERAGDVVAVGWMRPFFRYGVAALAALLGGQLIYSMFWYDEYFKVAPLAVVMFLTGAIGYYGASMLLAKTLRVFRGSWKGLALVAAGIAVVCGALKMDVFGAAGRVPEISQIQRAELYVDNNSYTFYPGEEDELLEQVRAVHAAIAADRDYILNSKQSDLSVLAEDALTHASVSLTYITTGGQEVQRVYYMPLTRDRLGRSGTYDYLLDQLVNSQEMRLKRIHANGDGYEPAGGSIYLNSRDEGYDLSDREAAAILEALTRDAVAGRWGQVNWLDTREETQGTAYAMSLSLSFRQSLEQNMFRNDWIDIKVRPEMTAVTACLMELGLVTSADLVTYAEMYPEEYGGESSRVRTPSAEAVWPETVSDSVILMGTTG